MKEEVLGGKKERIIIMIYLFRKVKNKLAGLVTFE